ncbi:MAG: M15 family metallopeptidase [Calditrichaceae bacterium]|nr:M15 family metallopeptidase [Calditrichia bacterium]NUQ40862.1 M15 family metallopeptidase [Calditrichaceae bacterium]
MVQKNNDVASVMILKMALSIAIALLFCSSCGSYPGGSREGGWGRGRDAPLLYDKFGFPVGGIYPLVTESGFVVEGFDPDLAPLVGFSSCSNRNAGRVTLYLHREALQYFELMQKEARKAGAQISICSAYRDYHDQKRIKRRYPGKAIDPGYSEHHLGTTVDLVNVHWNNREYRWLTGNAHRFGYILTYYRRPELGVGEPNHWRYVGREAAQTFYNLFGREY